MSKEAAVSRSSVAGAIWCVVAIALLVPAVSQAQRGTSAPTERPIDFSADVYPIFESRCHSCHGPQQQMGEFRLDSKGVALQGGVSGPNVVPGDAGKSALFQRISGIGDFNAMPMAGDRLSPAQIDAVRRWIDQGAAWPEGLGSSVGEIAKHWAYHMPVRDRPPSVEGINAVRNAIDSFLLARLEHEGLTFAPEALKPTLIRRVSLDLRGLPPTVDEVDRFLADESPAAYARLVDRMLKSPHFGEHWAGYWLDLARYADTNGYESDEPRSIWAYRDWVIHAFNRNLPFDRFTTEQLAGDLLPNPTVDQLVATGFHRNTMLNNEAGSKNDEFYDAAVKDRVDTTAAVWLGSTVGCAQCHDHKYDPFKQDEYYRLYAIFNNTADSAITLSEQLDVFKGDEDELWRRQDDVDASREVLAASTPALVAAQQQWESRTTPRLQRWQEAWSVLSPVSVTSRRGADSDVLPDGSALVKAVDEGSDLYEMVLKAEPGPLTGIRIEALGHDSLPANGPGRGEGGAFALAGIEMEVWSNSQEAGLEAALAGGPKWGSWHMIGPFRVGSRQEAFRTAFPPEANRDLAATYEDGHLAWLQKKDWTDGRVHYLGYIPDDDETNCASYAYRRVEVEKPTSVRISLGSLKGLKVWLDSDLVLSTDPTRSIAPDQEELQLDLQPGSHEILLKLTNDRGPYGFYFRAYLEPESEARAVFAAAVGDHGAWDAVDLRALLDGRSETAWRGESGAARGEAIPVATLRLERPFDLGEGSKLRLRLIHDSQNEPKGALGRFRISSTSLDREELAALQATPAKARRVLAIDAGQRSQADADQLAAHYRSIAPELESARQKHAELQSSLEAFRKEGTTKTLVMRELPEPRETRVQNRGNFLDLAERVDPGVPSVLATTAAANVGDRLELAEWLTSGQNPLTARVRVNQIWNRIFGRGLVTTPEDFGTQGEPPSHPRLMDWLAAEFIRLEWDTHALLRTIMLSAAYRQSSAASNEALAKDPDNFLMSRAPRYRMPAESVRDIALAASGLLAGAIGGPSVFPPQPAEVFGDHFIEGGFKQWPTSQGADRYRRGLYTFYKRTVVYPSFMNFDAPDRTVCTVDRSSSNTPLQALNTLNDPAFFEAAGSLAATMLSEPGESASERIIRGFRSVLARRPSPGEVERLSAFLDRMTAKYEEGPASGAELVRRTYGSERDDLAQAQLAPWVMVANVLLNLDETFTRE